MSEDVKTKMLNHLKIMEKEEKEIQDVQGVGQLGISHIASVSSKQYFIKPCPFSKIPELIGLVKKFETIVTKEGFSEAEILSDEDLRNNMMDIMLIGFRANHPELNKEIMGEEFTFKDFPVVYKHILGINDFLSQMRNIYQ